MIKKKIKAPLTPEQFKEKIKKSTIIMPSHATEGIGEMDSKDVKEFSNITIESVGWAADSIGIDQNGKEYPFPGGPWVNFNWSVPKFGFGQLAISFRGGKIKINSEGLGKDFVKAMLCDLVDKAEIK